MIDANTIQVLIQGGAVGIALSCLWIIYKLVTNHDAHLQTVVNRNTDAWIKNSSTNQKLIDVIERFHEK